MSDVNGIDNKKTKTNQRKTLSLHLLLPYLKTQRFLLCLLLPVHWQSVS